MFGKFDIRYRIMLVWLTAFIFLWISMYGASDINEMRNDLDEVIAGVQNDDWKQAEICTSRFSNEFYSKKYIVQINNATEIYLNFEYSVKQLELAVKNRQISALEYAGLLKEALDYTVKPFSGP